MERRAMEAPAARALPTLLVALVAAALAGCGSSSGGGGGGPGTEPSLGVPRVVVPGPGLPAEARINRSNNNLDVADHDGRLFLAFRTAPTHFASPDTRIYVISTDDVELERDDPAWRFETEIALGTDVREPRFLAWNGRLILYFAQLGANPTDFEPSGMLRTEYQGPGSWTTPEPTFEPGFIPWRFVIHDGRPVLSGYIGGEAIYDPQAEPLQIFLLTTEDGDSWVPLDPAQPVVFEGGGSETAIAYDARGDLYAVIRNEKGDADGFGAKICRAPGGDVTAFTCALDPRKYDSPLLIAQGDALFLVGRRNLTETGHYDLGSSFPVQLVKELAYELDYWLHPKRCSLWRVDKQSLAVSFELDLESAGDTCFPSALRRGPNRLLLFNYSSEPGQDPDPFWLQGQLGHTYIDAVELAFE